MATTARVKSPQPGVSHSRRSSSRCAQKAATAASATAGPPESAQKATVPARAGEKARVAVAPVTTTARAMKRAAVRRMGQAAGTCTYSTSASTSTSTSMSGRMSAPDLDHRRYRRRRAEDLAVRTADLFGACDVGDEQARPDDVCSGPAPEPAERPHGDLEAPARLLVGVAGGVGRAVGQETGAVPLTYTWLPARSARQYPKRFSQTRFREDAPDVVSHAQDESRESRRTGCVGSRKGAIEAGGDWTGRPILWKVGSDRFRLSVAALAVLGVACGGRSGVLLDYVEGTGGGGGVDGGTAGDGGGGGSSSGGDAAADHGGGGGDGGPHDGMLVLGAYLFNPVCVAVDATTVYWCEYGTGAGDGVHPVDAHRRRPHQDAHPRAGTTRGRSSSTATPSNT